MTSNPVDLGMIKRTFFRTVESGKKLPIERKISFRVLGTAIACKGCLSKPKKFTQVF